MFIKIAIRRGEFSAGQVTQTKKGELRTDFPSVRNLGVCTFLKRSYKMAEVRIQILKRVPIISCN